jgi:hypothetical protein
MVKRNGLKVLLLPINNIIPMYYGIYNGFKIRIRSRHQF